ncbi:hypothetical protein C7I55_10250 [Sphingomonas deserti]|uniref:Uncharacterized protein n=1 Tax=Allosphingosinicella deserti TaxID=2116704 RepID=A0A2P7QRU0_9SPHN|nr:hypothetical protein C7I55_10250 [Sphingomonas deserti]
MQLSFGPCCDPDRHLGDAALIVYIIKLGDLIAFDDVAWRYPDLLIRAADAHLALSGDLPEQRDRTPCRAERG